MFHNLQLFWWIKSIKKMLTIVSCVKLSEGNLQSNSFIIGELMARTP